MEDRDYKFTDEQVEALGFTSYEELEKYYDILYTNMSHPYNKQECVNVLESLGIEQRLDYSRHDRLKASLNDHIEYITEGWNDQNWIPSLEDIAAEKEALTRILNIFFSSAEKKAKTNTEKSPHRM